MKIEKEDYRNLIGQIDFLNRGKQTAEIRKDGEVFVIDFTYIEYGYWEPATLYTPSSWVKTDYDFEDVSFRSSNEDGETENDFNYDTFYKMAS